MKASTTTTADPGATDVSIIVPVHNGEETLPALLSAFGRLDYPPDRLEIIIVDNNSTDRTPELVRDSGFILLSETQVQSSYAARNLGLYQARGKFLAFTDADCEPDPGWLARGIASLGDADLVAGRKIGRAHV